MLKYLQFILLFSYLISKCLTAEQIIDVKLITTKTFMFWPNATVPFYINPDHFDHEQAMAIMTSLSMFAFKTCLKFAPVMASPDENQHVMTFINPEGTRRCRIEPRGHSNFHPHLILLGYECLQSPELDMIIMRALGLPFEHNRMSRDVYIDVRIENVEPSYIELFTRDNVLPPALRALPYDINSVMHFGERDYSKNGHRTIIFKNHNIRQNRIGLSATDLRKIELVYGPECRTRDRQEKIELCQSYPGVARRKREVEPPANKSLRVNPDITPPPSLLTESTVNTFTDNPKPLKEDIVDDGSEYITETLSSLGIANETEDILDQVYKVSALALKNARVKYCNQTTNDSTIEFNFNNVDKKKKADSSDILGILEAIADYAKSMVGSAVKNLTVFCQNPDSLEAYQRQCKFGYDSRCPKTYKSTKSGPVRHSTQHRPIIKQPTKHEGSFNRHQYDKNRRLYADFDDNTTPSLKPSRKKREVTETVGTPKPADEVIEKKPPKEKKILKEKAKVAQKEKVEVQKENSTVKIDPKSKEDKKELPRRFFKERRYKVKSPEEGLEMEWEESNVSLEKDKEKDPEKAAIKDQEIAEERDKQREEEDEREKEIEMEAEKIINKEELVKEVLNEGIDSILDAQKGKEVNGEQTEEVDEGKAEDDAEKLKEPAVELESKSSEETEKEEEKSNEEPADIETTTQKKKRHKKKAEKVKVKQIEVEEKKVKMPKLDKHAMEKRKRSHGSSPKTVKLNKLNKEFYDERRWPDGVVRYVIKKIPDYDLEDLRNRMAEVNSILTKKTCVKLHEVDAKEARGYDDYLVLDTSPDYVTGRVGGKQIFGCVELFRGGQHKQHTAMMVMAMLGFYFEVSRHDRDRHIRVHMRHVRPDKLHHFEKIREEATLDLPYDYKSATHPAWQFWRKIGKTGISTVATYKEQDPDGSVMRSLGQNPELLSESDIVKINSVYGVDCFQTNRASDKVKTKRQRAKNEEYTPIQ